MPRRATPCVGRQHATRTSRWACHCWPHRDAPPDQEHRLAHHWRAESSSARLPASRPFGRSVSTVSSRMGLSRRHCTCSLICPAWLGTGQRCKCPSVMPDASADGRAAGQPLTKHRLRDRFDAAREAADIPKAEFQFRDLRATAATAVDETSGTKQAQALLGHTTEGMTAHYIRHKFGKKVQPVR